MGDGLRAAVATAGLAIVLAGNGCRKAEAPLGLADSYLLLGPVSPAAQSVPGRFPVVKELDIKEGSALALSRLFADGFAAEMMRTVYLAKQLVREGGAGERRFSQAARAAAAEPVALLLSGASAGEQGRGLAFGRWLRSPEEHPNILWLGLPDDFEDDKALVQTVSGRLATHAIGWVARGFAEGPREAPNAVLIDAYRQSIEVIAREWRMGRGPQGAVAGTAGTATQRKLFSDIRDNRAVLTEDGRALRPASEMLTDPRVAATVLYRLAQTKGVAHMVASEAIYAPFVKGRIPEGVSPAAVLGPFRNFQAKLLSAWARAVLVDHPPRDIVDLVEAYLHLFPTERAEVVRVFVVTTYAAFSKPGGVSPRPGDATASLGELTKIIAQVTEGGGPLRLPAITGRGEAESERRRD